MCKCTHGASIYPFASLLFTLCILCSQLASSRRQRHSTRRLPFPACDAQQRETARVIPSADSVSRWVVSIPVCLLSIPCPLSTFCLSIVPFMLSFSEFPCKCRPQKIQAKLTQACTSSWAVLVDAGTECICTAAACCMVLLHTPTLHARDMMCSLRIRCRDLIFTGCHCRWEAFPPRLLTRDYFRHDTTDTHPRYNEDTMQTRNVRQSWDPARFSSISRDVS